MNRALPEMPVPGNVAGVKAMEMSLLERQRLGQVHPQLQQSCFSDLSLLPFLSGLDMGSGPEQSLTLPIMPDPGEGNNWVDFGIPKRGVTFEGSEIDSVGQVESCGYGVVNYTISTTASGSPLVVGEPKTKGRESLGSKQKLGLTAGKESSLKKRQVEMSPTPKGNAEEDSMSKRSKASGQEEESKITEQNSNQKESNANKNDKKNRESSGCATSKDNTKSTDGPKPDYIHVRARRGQATDSHSLAERVRREKISERMKYLQDLVPGCNKITGKAGMLDEIINYVQSLQRQVEVLSMKLAAFDPRLDLNIHDLNAREVFPTTGICQEMTNPSYLQYNPIQQMDPVCGFEATINPIDMGLRRTINAHVLAPETFIDPSCFTQIASSLPWHTDLQNMYDMEFQQGR